ncbi:MAG: ACP S-malonyltransferase [Acidimicrobiales bacterium]|nr:ACP S-malonyltransferase [Acidimicrobiales bacterium]
MASTQIAFTYPGQGSQAPGMGSSWTDHPSWELVAEASDVAERDIANLLLSADAEELRQTRNAQLSTFVLSMVVLDAVERLGIEPTMHAGHSLGEYSALVASGAVSFADGVRLVTERGNAMQAAADANPGTMAAVLGLDDELVELACEKANHDAFVANFNAPGQVVIAGSEEGIAAAGDLAKSLGAKRVMPIKVGGAFHTPFMASAGERLGKALKDVEFRMPERPVVANVDAQFHSGEAEWPELLSAQLISPVQWRQSLHTMEESGASLLVELGPGSVLSGMAKRTVPSVANAAVSTPEGLDRLLEELAHSPKNDRSPDGEFLYASERLVVSPASGVFTPLPATQTGHQVGVGELIGHVGKIEVRTAFAGELHGMLAFPGERVASSQPIAWLRVQS